jgi:hypothetical protein
VLGTTDVGMVWRSPPPIATFIGVVDCGMLSVGRID